MAAIQREQVDEAKEWQRLRAEETWLLPEQFLQKAAFCRALKDCPIEEERFVVKNSFIDESPRQRSEGSRTRSNSAPAPGRLSFCNVSKLKFKAQDQGEGKTRGNFKVKQMTEALEMRGINATGPEMVLDKKNGKSRGYGFFHVVCNDVNYVEQAMVGTGVTVVLARITQKFK